MVYTSWVRGFSWTSNADAPSAAGSPGDSAVVWAVALNAWNLSRLPHHHQEADSAVGSVGGVVVVEEASEADEAASGVVVVGMETGMVETEDTATGAASAIEAEGAGLVTAVLPAVIVGALAAVGSEVDMAAVTEVHQAVSVVDGTTLDHQEEASGKYTMLILLSRKTDLVSSRGGGPPRGGGIGYHGNGGFDGPPNGFGGPPPPQQGGGPPPGGMPYGGPPRQDLKRDGGGYGGYDDRDSKRPRY